MQIQYDLYFTKLSTEGWGERQRCTPCRPAAVLLQHMHAMCVVLVVHGHWYRACRYSTEGNTSRYRAVLCEGGEAA